MKKSIAQIQKKTSIQFQLKPFIFTVLLIPLTILLGFPLRAQTSNPDKAQWESVGGKMLFSGKQEFTETWTSSTYSRAKNLWWQGSYYDLEEDRNYQDWESTVKNSVSPLIGNITVSGPCNICVKQSGKGGRIKMIDKETQNGFTFCNLNNRTTFNGDFWGFVAENTEVTLDVYAFMSEYNNMVNTGEYAFHAPQDVEYEVWYFPRGEGSEVVITGGQKDPGDEMGNIVFGKEKCENDNGINHRSARQESSSNKIWDDCMRDYYQEKLDCEKEIHRQSVLKREKLQAEIYRHQSVMNRLNRLKNEAKAKKVVTAVFSIETDIKREESNHAANKTIIAKPHDEAIKFQKDYINTSERYYKNKCDNIYTCQINSQNTKKKNKIVNISKGSNGDIAAIKGKVSQSNSNGFNQINGESSNFKTTQGQYEIKANGSVGIDVSGDKMNISGDNNKVHFKKKQDAPKYIKVLQTIHATIRPKKTEFVISNNNYRTEVCVIEGMVTVSPINIACDSVNVSTGQCISIDVQGEVSDYTNLDVDQLGKWWEDWPLVIGMDDDEIRKIDGGSIGHFLNGLFDVEIKTPEHSFNTSWMVFSEGSLVDVIPGDDQYPYYQEGILRAFIDEDKLYIYNDCSDSKGVSSCDQIFTGILNNGLVSGEFMIDGRKSGTWTMRPSGKIKTQDFGETINPIADSHIYQYTYSNWNKASWGGYDKLGVGYHPSGGEKRAYLKFDIGNVQPNDIGKTTLKLYQYHTSGSTDLKLGIYEVTENWNEGRGLYKPQTLATGNEICWINQPDFETTLLSSFSPGSSINQWVEVDVTELVRNWAAGMPNNGLMIKGIGSFSGMGESMYGFYSREWEDQSLRPQLIITPMRKEGDVVTSDYDSEPISSMTKEVAGVLDGLRWELPCNGTGNTCGAKVQRPSETAILGGDPNQLYEVTLRFRGVVEYHSYSGGQQDGLWYIGGKSNQGSFNIYQLQTTDPVQTFFLNAEKSGIYRCWPIDYTRKIKVKGGSKVILSANAQDGALIGNHDGKGKPIIIPGIAPAPEPFNGQFIQMDVLSVVPVSVN